MSDKIVVPKVYKRWPILIDEQGFRRFFDELGKILGEGHEINIKIIYSDKSSHETNSIERLLSDENRKGRRIIEVVFSGKNDSKEIEIKLGKTKLVKDEEKYFPYIYVDITGPDRQWVFVAQSEIEDRLKSFKASLVPSFMIAAIIDASILLSGFLIPFVFRSHLRLLFTTGVPAGSETLRNLYIISLLGIVLFVTIIIALLYRDITFCVGQEIERHQNRLKLRSNIFWSIFISFIIGMIISFIFKFF